MEGKRQSSYPASGKLSAPATAWSIGHFVTGVLLPHQAGDQIGNGAIPIVLVTRRVARVLGVLSVKTLTFSWAGSFGVVIIAVALSSVHDGIGQVGSLCACGCVIVSD